MDKLSESDDNSGYNSDEINSDIEVELYGAIHHMYGSDGHELAPNSADVVTETEPKATAEDKPIGGQKTCESPLNSSDSSKPLNNLFRLLDTRLDVSDNEFDKDFVFNDNTEDIDLIEIDDSGDDSDVIIIDEKSGDGKRKAKSPDSRRSKASTSGSNRSNRSEPNLSLSLGNVSNLDETAVSAMNQFYDEDDYDSEEEERSFNALSSDRSLWRVSYTDTLVGLHKPNRYYRSKVLCNNCNERGHMARDCPLPKKVLTCYLCGGSGHRGEKCRSVLCSKCLSGTHRTINCNSASNALVCDGCGVRGHVRNQCTYNWRKYHLTTTYTAEEPIVFNLRPNVRKSCYNCGAFGKHFGFECRLKGMSKHTTPVSPLMSTLRQSHCFNGREDNNKRDDCDPKALCNEFVKSISSNELRSCLSASFNKPLDDFHLCHTIATTSSGTPHTVTTASTPAHHSLRHQNKHIKWVYPDINDSSHGYGSHSSRATHTSHSSTPIARKCPKNRAISEPIVNTVFNDSSPLTSAFYALDATHTAVTAHTLTHRQINNWQSMQPTSQTTPQLSERAQQRRIRRKMKKLAQKMAQKREHHLLKEANGPQFQTIDSIDKMKKTKQRKKFRRDRNRMKKRQNQSQ